MDHRTLTDGQIIRFSTIPAGSYASADTPYWITRGAAHIHLRNVRTGGGTSDSLWAYGRAVWEVTTATDDPELVSVGAKEA